MSYFIPTKSFIHGEWVESSGSERLTLRSAYDGSTVTDIQVANTKDVDLAVESAEKGLVAWQALPPQARRQLLNRFADVIVENKKHLAHLETIVTGKGFDLTSEFEVTFAAEWFRYYAGLADKETGEYVPAHDGSITLVRREPYGVCAGIVACNGPLIICGMKVAPALTAGNVIIVKPSESNPLSTLLLGELAIKAGIPPGVINITLGANECGSALSSHMKIRLISFTGSVNVGKKVQIAATQSNLKRVLLELGGKSPVLVFQDADVSFAVGQTLNYLRNNGQVCVNGTRVYVHEDILDKFQSEIVALSEKFASDLGSDPTTPWIQTQPLYHHQQMKSVMGVFERTRDVAQILTGGVALPGEGCYVKPTIYLKPKPGSEILTEETFGPVISLDSFKTEEEVLQKANDTRYGLGAYLYTKDLDRILRVSAKLEAGTICVNGHNPLDPTVPFGGYKESGIGRECGKYGLDEYTQIKSIRINKILPPLVSP